MVLAHGLVWPLPDAVAAVSKALLVPPLLLMLPKIGFSILAANLQLVHHSMRGQGLRLQLKLLQSP